MKILSIETSCDDTGISIVKIPQNKKRNFKILSNLISSQIKIHKKYGGVFPMMAKREHQKNLVPLFEKAMAKANTLGKKLKIKNQNNIEKVEILKIILSREKQLSNKLIPFLQKYEKPDIDLIAVTEGPGLEPCLWVGINFAKALSFYWNIPVIPVNHIESHILVNYLNNKTIQFPAICLIVSGGHTQLILMKKVGKYKIIGETRDDAAGECFDKAAKILGLDYPGGPIISKLALMAKNQHFFIKLPRPMIGTKDYDFSFSGLKTSVLYNHAKQPKRIRESKEYIAQMSTEIQQAIIDVLIKKTVKAARNYKVKTIILGGGVSANKELKKQLKEKISQEIPVYNFLVPEPLLSTDNALMIAITGYFHKTKTKNWRKLIARANLRME